MGAPKWRTQTIPQVASRLGISVKSLRAACARGDVQTETFNGVVMILPREERRIGETLGIVRANKANVPWLWRA
jgi:hypothetical protein